MSGAHNAAIVGIGCRLPGADSAATLWEILKSSRCTVGAIPEERFGSEWRKSGLPDHGGFLDRVDLFDAGFFGLSRREAELADPQQRLLMQVAWEAFDDAGIPQTSLRRLRTGWFVGLHGNEYDSMSRQASRTLDGLVGGGRYGAADTLSRFFATDGPALVLDADRSSSLVAIHTACHALSTNRCDVAVAAAANLILTLDPTMSFHRAGLLAADGRCKFGNAGADGFVRSEAILVVVVKPLDRALADRDRIYATIMGSAVGHVGRGVDNIMSPSRAGQEAVLRAAYAAAGVAPSSVSSVEAHGPGTPAGDPVEVASLISVLSENRPSSVCRLGSIKTNVGHTEAAAGMAGLVKTALSLYHGEIPASLHCEPTSPALPRHDLFALQREHQRWSEVSSSRVAGVSAFGLTGSMAHVVLRAIDATPSQSGPTGHDSLLPISAADEQALRQRARQLAEALAHVPQSSLGAWCEVSTRRRAHLQHRAIVRATTIEDAISAFDALARDETHPLLVSGQRLVGPSGRVALALGRCEEITAQWLQAAVRELPGFGDLAREIDARGKAILGTSVLADSIDDGQRVTVQLVAHLALATWWQARGVVFSAVLGHGVAGELAASHLAGLTPLDEAFRRLATTTEQDGEAGEQQTRLAVAALFADGIDLVLEPGPASDLTAVLVGATGDKARLLTGLVGEGSLTARVERGLSSLYVAGAVGDWYLVGRPPVPALDLPSYPWNEQRYWHDDADQVRARRAEATLSAEPGDASATASPAGSSPEAMIELLREIAAKVIGIPRTHVDPATPFRDLGMTSLMEAELRSMLRVKLGRTFPAGVTFAHPTIKKLAASLVTSKPVDSGSSLLEAQLDQAASQTAEPIAVVGMACRFPKNVASSEALWLNLRDGIDAISSVPVDRWDGDEFFDADPDTAGRINTREGGFVSGIDLFDPQFFGISPREAEFMDPQQRLLLETAWEALERAGQDPEALDGTATGVFVGILNHNDYAEVTLRRGVSALSSAHFVTGNATSVAAGRIAYSLGLQGPAVSVDTACSSSLTAIHLACQSVRSGESELAVAGGVSVLLSPVQYIAFAKGHFLADDGRCKTFDSRANGYARGEGCGIVVLKRLSKAIANGDTILGVIVGSGLNQDGRSAGLTAPNGTAQAALYRRVRALSGLSTPNIAYLEAHGTGTPLGDPIEVRSWQDARDPGDGERTIVGAVKSSVGHLEAASGVIGLIKTLLVLQNREVPPNLHLQQTNPEIDLRAIRVMLPTARGLLPARRDRHAAAVSAFGISGTNAHVIVTAPLESEGPAAGMNLTARGVHLCTLSAKTADALREQAERWARHLLEKPSLSLSDVCFTANVGRSQFRHRLAVVANDTHELHQQLRAWTLGRKHGLHLGEAPQSRGRLAMCFGDTSRHLAGAGSDLYASSADFRDAIDHCNQLTMPLGVQLMRSSAFVEPSVAETRVTRDVAAVCLQWAMAATWRAWGISEAAVIGHGLGEIVAACVGGVLTLEDALRLVVRRAELLNDAPSGVLVAVRIDRGMLDAALRRRPAVRLAADNGPAGFVVGGAASEVQAFVNLLPSETPVQILAPDRAMHTTALAPVAEALRPFARSLSSSAARSTIVLMTRGDVVATGQTITPESWCDQVMLPLQVASVLRLLVEQGIHDVLELTPAGGLGALARQVVGTELAWHSALRRGETAWAAHLNSAAALFVHGHVLDWSRVERGHSRRRVVMPTYPFRRRRFWVSTATAQAAPKRIHPFIASVSEGPDGEHTCVLDLDGGGMLGGHRVADTVIVPAAAICDLALAAAQQCFGRERRSLAGIELLRALPLGTDDADAKVEVVLGRNQNDRHPFELRRRVGDQLTTYARGWVHATGPSFAAVPLSDRRASITTSVPVSSHYEACRRLGFDYGGAFEALRDLWTGVGHGGPEALGRARLPDTEHADAFVMHPATLDACFQMLFSVIGVRPDDVDPYVPVALGTLTLLGKLTSTVWVHARRSANSTLEVPNIDLDVWSENGELALTVRELAARRTPRAVLAKNLSATRTGFLELEWRGAPRLAAAAGVRDRWWVIGDGPVASALATELRDRELLAAPVISPLSPDLAERVGHSAAAASAVAIVLEGELDLPARESLVHCTRLLEIVRRMLGGTASVRRLVIVTAGAEPRGALPPNPELAAVWGFARSLRREHPELGVRLVDVPTAAAGSVAMAVDEIEHGADAEVRIGGDQRAVGSLNHVTLEPRAARRFRADGTYWITGGLGAIGRKVARWLAEQGAGQIALSSRSEVSAEVAADLAAIEARGARLVVLHGDVADRTVVRRVVEQAHGMGLPLRGVFHVAGILEDQSVLGLTAEQLRRVAHPKVAGVRALHEGLAGADLDCFVLFSSIVAVEGNAGQAAYAAANAFMDGFAEWRRAQGLAAASINWGAWGGDGMAAGGKARASLAHAGILSFHPSEGLTALAQAIDSGRTRVAFARLTQRDPARSVPSSKSRRLGPASTRTMIERTVALLAAEVLGLREGQTIDATEPLATMGLDSVMSLELRRRLSETIDLPVTPTVAFDYPTVDAMANYVESLLRPPGSDSKMINSDSDELDVAVPADIEGMSDDEARRLLLEELDELTETGESSA